MSVIDVKGKGLPDPVRRELYQDKLVRGSFGAETGKDLLVTPDLGIDTKDLNIGTETFVAPKLFVQPIFDPYTFGSLFGPLDGLFRLVGERIVRAARGVFRGSAPAMTEQNHTEQIATLQLDKSAPSGIAPSRVVGGPSIVRPFERNEYVSGILSVAPWVERVLVEIQRLLPQNIDRSARRRGWQKALQVTYQSAVEQPDIEHGIAKPLWWLGHFTSKDGEGGRIEAKGNGNKLHTHDKGTGFPSTVDIYNSRTMFKARSDFSPEYNRRGSPNFSISLMPDGGVSLSAYWMLQRPIYTDHSKDHLFRQYSRRHSGLVVYTEWNGDGQPVFADAGLTINLEMCSEVQQDIYISLSDLYYAVIHKQDHVKVFHLSGGMTWNLRKITEAHIAYDTIDPLKVKIIPKKSIIESAVFLDLFLRDIFPKLNSTDIGSNAADVPSGRGASLYYDKLNPKD